MSLGVAGIAGCQNPRSAQSELSGKIVLSTSFDNLEPYANPYPLRMALAISNTPATQHHGPDLLNTFMKQAAKHLAWHKLNKIMIISCLKGDKNNDATCIQKLPHPPHTPQTKTHIGLKTNNFDIFLGTHLLKTLNELFRGMYHDFFQLKQDQPYINVFIQVAVFPSKLDGEFEENTFLSDLPTLTKTLYRKYIAKAVYRRPSLSVERRTTNPSSEFSPLLFFHFLGGQYPPSLSHATLNNGSHGDTFRHKLNEPLIDLNLPFKNLLPGTVFDLNTVTSPKFGRLLQNRLARYMRLLPSHSTSEAHPSYHPPAPYSDHLGILFGHIAKHQPPYTVPLPTFCREIIAINLPEKIITDTASLSCSRQHVVIPYHLIPPTVGPVTISYK